MTSVPVEVVTPVGPGRFTGLGNAELTAALLSELLIAGSAISLTLGSAGITIASTTDGGITQLTGDVAAGPGAGSAVATLANTAVTPGSYTYTALTVDAKGRLTAAANGSPPVAPPTAANPTATVGPAAVNGAAATFMRSDAAPALTSTFITGPVAVGALPAAGTAGRTRLVNDALGPVFLAVVVGGGGAVCPVFDDGTNWVVG